MSFITLDFETPFKRGNPNAYSLVSATYEEYIRDERFNPFGVGIKIDDKPTYWVSRNQIKEHITQLFYPGNGHALLCHNTPFDGAILHWYYGVKPAKYYDTLSMAKGLWHQSKNNLKQLSRKLFPNQPELWKGDELETVEGLFDLTPEQEKVLADYCIQDVEVTFACFSKLWTFFPQSEMKIIDATIRMFVEPVLRVDRPAVEQYLVDLDNYQTELMERVEQEFKLSIYIQQQARVFSDWLSNFCETYKWPGTFVFEKYSPIVMKILGWDQRTFHSKDLRYTQLDVLLRQVELPPFFSFHAYKAVRNEQSSDKIIASNAGFASYLELRHGITVPLKHSPTQKNPNNYTLALAKDDLAFLDFQKNYPELSTLWEARICLSSVLERTRGERFLNHSQPSHINHDGTLAVLLNYGGTLTNRWSGGNAINLQNLGRKSPLRKSLQAPPGHVVLVSDLSNIEGRVLAWFAGQTDKVEAFRQGRDLYSEFASEIYRRPVDRKRTAIHPETGEEYKPDEVEGFIGKVCIAEGTPVLTNQGWIPIEQVSIDQKIWDGEEWSHHDGVLKNGWKECIKLSGIYLTPDHKILCGKRWKEAHVVVENENTLYQALAHAKAHLPSLGTLWENSVVSNSSLLNAIVTNGNTRSIPRILKPLKQPVVCFVQMRRRLRNGIGNMQMPSQMKSIVPVYSIDCHRRYPDAITLKTRCTSAMGPEGYSYQSNGETTEVLSLSMCKRWKGGITQTWTWIEQMLMRGIRKVTSGSSHEKKTNKTDEAFTTLSDESASLKRKLRVYDVANAGPRNRYTILTPNGPLIVHNCELGLGYSMSPPTFQLTLAKGAMGGPQIFFDDAKCKEIVHLWRTRNYKIKASWAQADKVIYDMACKRLEPYMWNCIRVEPGRLLLPNGLYLNYPDIRAHEQNERISYTYWNGRFDKNLYGGLLIENIVQALARIIMANMLVNVNEQLQPLGGRVVLTVHDELVAVTPETTIDQAQKIVEKIMRTPPEWAPDLPLDCEAGYDHCYSK